MMTTRRRLCLGVGLAAGWLLWVAVLVVAALPPARATSSGSVGGALVLIERATVAAAVTTVTFSNLNGNNDNLYLVTYAVDADAGGVLRIQPNGISTSQETERVVVSGGAVTGGTTADLRPGGLDATQMLSGQSWITADSAIPRAVTSLSTRRNGASGMQTEHSSAIWDETATNITSLEVESDAVGAIDARSIITLFRLQEAGT